jgi:Cof subfamily protein (haloacid dehalogenase superfamily)
MAKQLPSWNTDDVDSLFPFSKIRLIAVDLDGTLLSPTTSFNLSTIRFLQNSIKHYGREVEFTIATGRTLTGVNSVLNEMPLKKGIPLILYNGSVIVRNSNFTILFQQVIDYETTQIILELSAQYNAQVYIYKYIGPNSNFLTEEPFEYVLGWSKEKTKNLVDFNGIKIKWLDSSVLTENISPSAILIDISKMKDNIGLIEKLSDIPVSLTKSGGSFIEIRPKGSNKGVSLQKVASFLSLSQEQVLSLGDNDNDCEMLEWAGIGVSVANASKNALKSSDYYCRYGVNEGAIEVLRLIRNAKRYFPNL